MWGWGWLTGRRRRSRWILLHMLAEVLGRGERVVRLCFVVLFEEGEGGRECLPCDCEDARFSETHLCDAFVPAWMMISVVAASRL